MFRTAPFLGLMAVVALGCDGRKDAPRTTPRTAEGELIRVRPAALPSPAPPSPAPPRAALRQTIRLTSEGEPMRVEVPTLDPVLEVPVGSACGVLNQRGELLSCQAGTLCVSSSNVNGAPATCQPAPRAPRWDG